MLNNNTLILQLSKQQARAEKAEKALRAAQVCATGSGGGIVLVMWLMP